MDKTRAARHRCNDDRARESTTKMDDASIARAELYGGVITAVSFGLMMLHWAVV